MEKINTDLDALKKEQEMHRLKMRENRDKVKRRKQRTHRLIVRGAISEAAIPGSQEMTDEQFQTALYLAIDKGKEGDGAPGHPQDPRGSALRGDPSGDARGSDRR